MSTQLYFSDPFGGMQTIIKKFSRLEYMRAENKVGWLTLDVDPRHFDTHLLRLDERIEPWRQVGGNQPYLDGESVFFLRKWRRRIDTQGREYLRLWCWDANYLLAGRAIPNASGGAYTKKTAAIDDLMKAIVREQLGSLSWDAYRDYGSQFAVQANLSAAPSTTKEFFGRQVLGTLSDLAAESLTSGTYLAFDIVYVDATHLEFRTYTGQRGINHGNTSGQRVIVSREARNLEEPETTEDHENEYPYIYAGGQGVGSGWEPATAGNTAAVYASPWNRRDIYVRSGGTGVTASSQSEANAALSNYRARKSLTGKLVDTKSCMDGVHYRYGDVVYAQAFGQGYDAHLSSLHVTIEAGHETRENPIRGEA
jgi:hypothetical protein